MIGSIHGKSGKSDKSGKCGKSSKASAMDVDVVGNSFGSFSGSLSSALKVFIIYRPSGIYVTYRHDDYGDDIYACGNKEVPIVPSLVESKELQWIETFDFFEGAAGCLSSGDGLVTLTQVGDVPEEEWNFLSETTNFQASGKITFSPQGCDSALESW